MREMAPRRSFTAVPGLGVWTGTMACTKVAYAYMHACMITFACMHVTIACMHVTIACIHVCSQTCAVKAHVRGCSVGCMVVAWDMWLRYAQVSVCVRKCWVCRYVVREAGTSRQPRVGGQPAHGIPICQRWVVLLRVIARGNGEIKATDVPGGVGREVHTVVHDRVPLRQ